MSKARKPTAADRYMGERIAEARHAQKMTRYELAALIGVSWQQVQKYENGRNRVIGARLGLLATALNRPLAYFFQNPTDIRAKADPIVSQFIASKEGYAFAQHFPRIPAAVRPIVVALVVKLSEEG